MGGHRLSVSNPVKSPGLSLRLRSVQHNGIAGRRSAIVNTPQVIQGTIIASLVVDQPSMCWGFDATIPQFISTENFLAGLHWESWVLLFDGKHFWGRLKTEKHIRGHFRWFVGCFVILLVASLYYWYYASNAPNGPTGGSWPGLVYGVIGSAFMLFAGAFNWRKKFPRAMWMGSAQFWMRGHIWLGTISLPLILFHSGWRLGGLVETVLMIVVFTVWLSGVFGLVMQQYMPKSMMNRINAEAMYQQVDEVCRQLRMTADNDMKKCGDLFEPEGANPQLTHLKQFYLSTVRPFLQEEYQADSGLANASEADALFDAVRNSVSPNLHADIEKLETMCNERRDLEAQRKMHGWLHIWLFVHIPLSMTLLVMGIIHVVSALWY